MTEGEHRLDFREMTEADLTDGLRLSRASGWNQTLEDWRLLLSLGPGLFRVAVEGGRVVASGGAVRYGDALAWICMILVDPERRGRGIGTRVFDEVLARCEADVRAGRLRCVGLDATPAGRGIYVQRGFTDDLPPQLVRMRSESVTQADSPVRVKRLEASDLDGILARDLAVFGADRRAVLRWTFESAVNDTLRPGRRHSWDKHTGWQRIEGTSATGQTYCYIENLNDSTGWPGWTASRSRGTR